MSDNDAPSAGRPGPGGQTGSKAFSAPLGPANSGRLVFLSGASNVYIHADLEGPDLFRARFEGRAPTVVSRGGTVTIDFPGFPPFDWLHHRRERPDEVALNVSVPWHVEVREGAFGLTADLRGLELGSLRLRGGAGRVELALPAPSGTVAVRVLGGANNLAVRFPGGIPARIRVEGGVTGLTFGEERLGAAGGEVDLRSSQYQGASDRYDIAVTGGANAVTIGAW